MRYRKYVFALAIAFTVMSAMAQDSLDDLERRLEAAKNAQAKEHAEAGRKAEASRRADASRATMVIKVNGDCALSVNGDSLGRLTANQTRTVKVNAGEQLIECAAADGQRIETTERIAAGEQKVLRLSLSGGAAPKEGASSDERFSAVADGVRDVQQNVVWAARDNGANLGWDQATQYCSGLGSGWSLPAVAQLQSIYDDSGQFGKTIASNGHSVVVKVATSIINLAGVWYWSSEANGYANAWFVSLADGKRYSIDAADRIGLGALCVRHP